MSQLSLVCLSLTPNLRCVGFTLGQFEALVIPPVIEVILSLLFIYLYSGPGRWAQILLAADSVLYFIWALLDMLSHVAPAARTSLSVLTALDFVVGAVSFTPILIYSIYLYRLSFHDFIPTLPRKLQPYLEISLPILLLTTVAINEVASFVGIQFGTSSNQHFVVEFSHNGQSLWQSLSWSSLAIYVIVQFLFFLLAFSRLSRAFLGQRRIELTHADECHYFHGIAWITVGIIVGVVETLSGFARASFSVVLARRILRLSARALLMYGLLKGLDVAESFETLTNELRGVARFNRCISGMLGVNPRRTDMFHRIPHSYPKRQANKYSRAERQSADQRVTVHYEKGRAPLLQIRFSVSDFPTQSIFADVAQHRSLSLSGLIPGHTSVGSCTQKYGEDVPNDFATARNMTLEIPRVKSALEVHEDSHHIPPDWIRPPERSYTRRESGGAVSDRMSIVRELERSFPNLPPRVTGKYRGSILGQNYEEDPFPVVGVSRQSSLRQDGSAPNRSEESVASVALSPSNSIKRKPAPPLLEGITYISDRRKRPKSTWGGLTQNTVSSMRSPAVFKSSPEGTAAYSPDSTQARETCTPRPRRTTALDMIRRASRGVSDASIRSAEWLASASSPWSTQAPLTVADIEMYRNGNLGPGSASPQSGEIQVFGEHSLPVARRSTDDAGPHSKLGRSHTIARISIGKIPVRTEHTLRYTGSESERERASANSNSTQPRQTTVTTEQQVIEPECPG